MENSISIIIPTYNKSSFLNLTLAGFVNQTYQRFKLVIVDDGSVDNTKQRVESYSNLLDITYVYQENHGRSVARNTGLKKTTSNQIIFCDDDRIPNPKFVEIHHDHMEKYPKSIAVGMKNKIITRYDPSNPLQDKQLHIILRYIKETKEELSEKLFFNEKDLMYDFDNTIQRFSTGVTKDNHLDVIQQYGKELVGFYFPWIIGTTANMSFTRDTIEDFLFDEHYSSWGMEDTDFSYMLYQKGYQFFFADGAMSYHQQHRSNFLSEKQSLNRNIKYFCQKYDELSCYLYANLYGIKNFNMVELNELYSALRKDTDKAAGLLETLKKLLTNTLY